MVQEHAADRRFSAHLVAIDHAAERQMEQILAQLEKASPAPDKETDQLGWVVHMNGLRGMAEEVVLQELVCA